MAYKINASNYSHIHKAVLSKGIAVVSKAYSIDKTTLGAVKNHDTFAEYKEYISKKSREQYARRLKKQRERAVNNVQSINKTSPVPTVPRVVPTPQAPKIPTPVAEKPFSSTPELGVAKTIITEVKKETPMFNNVKTPETEFKMFKEDSPRTSNSQKYPSMDRARTDIAIKMAREGAFRNTIAHRLGYPNSGTMLYHLRKEPALLAEFENACSFGSYKYRESFAENVSAGKAKEKQVEKTQPKKEQVKLEEPKLEEPKLEEPKSEPTTEQVRMEMSPEYNFVKITDDQVKYSKDYLLYSIGGAIRVISIGLLAILFALAIQIIASAINAVQ